MGIRPISQRIRRAAVPRRPPRRTPVPRQVRRQLMLLLRGPYRSRTILRRPWALKPAVRLAPASERCRSVRVAGAAFRDWRLLRQGTGVRRHQGQRPRSREPIPQGHLGRWPRVRHCRNLLAENEGALARGIYAGRRRRSRSRDRLQGRVRSAASATRVG